MSTLHTRPSLRRLAAVATAAVVLPFTLTACGEAAERAAEEAAEDALKSEGIDVDIDGDEVKVENSDGSFVSGTKLPDDFPEDDVPLVGDVQAGSTSNVDGKKGWTVTTRSDGSEDDAFNEATTELEGAGFKSEDDAVGGYAVFTSDTYQVVVTSTSDQQGGAILSYLVGAAE